jgi:hypothetical protein
MTAPELQQRQEAEVRLSHDAQQKANLERYGSTPGLQVEWDSRDGKLSAD